MSKIYSCYASLPQFYGPKNPECPKGCSMTCKECARDAASLARVHGMLPEYTEWLFTHYNIPTWLAASLFTAECSFVTWVLYTIVDGLIN